MRRETKGEKEEGKADQWRPNMPGNGDATSLLSHREALLELPALARASRALGQLLKKR
jgi:hypothetical protein